MVHCTTNDDDDNFAFVVSGPACWGDSQWQTLLADCHALCSHDPAQDDDDHLVDHGDPADEDHHHLVDGDPAQDDDDHDNDHVGGAQDDQLDGVEGRYGKRANITTIAVFCLGKCLNLAQNCIEIRGTLLDNWSVQIDLMLSFLKSGRPSESKK